MEQLKQSTEQDKWPVNLRLPAIPHFFYLFFSELAWKKPANKLPSAGIGKIKWWATWADPSSFPQATFGLLRSPIFPIFFPIFASSTGILFAGERENFIRPRYAMLENPMQSDFLTCSHARPHDWPENNVELLVGKSK